MSREVNLHIRKSFHVCEHGSPSSSFDLALRSGTGTVIHTCLSIAVRSTAAAEGSGNL